MSRTPANGTVQITELLGSGGMAAVWKGIHYYPGGLQRPCAVKKVRPDLVGNPEYLRRLQQEAAIGLEATVGHPALLTTRDYSSIGGSPSVLLDLVDGPSLDTVLREGPLPCSVVRLIARDILGALAHLRDLHIAHRDVSPGNIMIDTAGRVFLADFGLAKRVTEHSPGISMGTLAYASPEMIRGQQVGCATDAYSLGAVLSELLTGEPPRGQDLETVVASLDRLPELPDTAPGDLRELIHGLSAVRPAHRLTPRAALKLVEDGDDDARDILGDIAREFSAATHAAQLQPIPDDGQATPSVPLEALPHIRPSRRFGRYAGFAAAVTLCTVSAIAWLNVVPSSDSDDSLAAPKAAHVAPDTEPSVEDTPTGASRRGHTTEAQRLEHTAGPARPSANLETLKNTLRDDPEPSIATQATTRPKPPLDKNDPTRKQSQNPQTDTDIALDLLAIDDTVVTAQTPNGGVLALTPTGRVGRRFRWKITIIGGYEPTEARARCSPVECTDIGFEFSGQQGWVEIAADESVAKVTLLLSRDNGHAPLIIRNIPL